MIVKRFGCTTITIKRYINASFIHSSYGFRLNCQISDNGLVLLAKVNFLLIRCQMMVLTQQVKLCHLLAWMTAVSNKGELVTEKLFLRACYC